MKTLLKCTLLITMVLLVSNIYAQSANVSYTDYTVYSKQTTAPGGFSIITSTKPGSAGFPTLGSGVYLYQINVFNLNTTAEILTFYDATTYTDATLNNRPILAQIEYGVQSTYYRYYHNILLSPSAGDVTNCQKGWCLLGDVGGQFNYVQESGWPRRLTYGVTAFLSTGVASWEVVYRKY